jgi:hypothetical protein
MGNIRPHLVRYWLHSTEKSDNPEIFAQKAEQICEAYHNAPNAEQNGTHTVSVDEMTGIQALERKYPDKPTAPGQIARIEFEYSRHGTVSLIAFFDVATGKICSQYLNKTRTEEDFVTAVKALIDTASGDKWIFIWNEYEKARCNGHFHCVPRQTQRLGRRYKRGVSKDEAATLHCPSNPQFYSVCQLQRPQGNLRRPQENLRCG